MKDGFIKVAAGTPAIRVADCTYNAARIIALAREADAAGVRLLVLPELCITGYTCGDLFLQQTLLSGALSALARILEETAELDLLLLPGLPFPFGSKLYNCAAVCHKGKLLGLVPKTHIPNYGEFYERRHFASGAGLCETAAPFGYAVPLSANQLFACRALPAFTFGVEICEDLWVPDAPSSLLCREGAAVIANLSASDEVIGKAEYRRLLVCTQSGRLVCGYLYADAGEGESTTDMVFSGHSLIAQNGALLAEHAPFSQGLCIAEFDVLCLASERRRMTTYPQRQGGCQTVFFDMELRPCALSRRVSASPFVPEGDAERAERCELILRMQATGLATRMQATHCAQAVIGVSGGLDSTLALLVAARTLDLLSLPRKNLVAVTMPCFGTTRRTRTNSHRLAQALGATLREIDITAAVAQHFKDIGHDPALHDTTFENCQARERTQVLMDIANQVNGLVIGTGDLSELALGWATYNGDHMSMYGVNASVPKTLVRHLVRYAADTAEDALRTTLLDVLDTPVSPELLPAKDGEISQVTEDLVGPYALHDFFLYYALRWAFPPEKILRLAESAFAGVYDSETIRKWLQNFYRRFFRQQFKRSCLPDGPKIGSVTLSPRGDWRMPSDASAALWLAWAEQK